MPICVQHMPSLRTLTAGCLARCKSPTDNQYSPSWSRQIRLTGVLLGLECKTRPTTLDVAQHCDLQRCVPISPLDCLRQGVSGPYVP